MKLQTKFALYNAFSKTALLLVLIALLPYAIDQAAYLHIDYRLKQKKDKVLNNSNKNGINDFLQKEQKTAAGSYNILKEEYISIEKTHTPIPNNLNISTDERKIDNDIYTYRVLSYTFRHNGQLYLLEIGESLGTIAALKTTLFSLTLILLLVVITISLVSDISYTKYLLRPLGEIIERKLKQIDHPSAFKFIMVGTTTNDFKYLDQSINEMMFRIKDAFRIEKEFISNVSHELLTPISIIQNRFDNLLNEEKVPDVLKVKLVESQRTLFRLKKIIKTLLLISKIENHQYLKEDKVKLEELVEEVIEEIRDRALSGNIHIQHSLEPFVIEEANKELLFTLFFNLLNNAIKYNNENGSIKIAGNFFKNSYVLTISDTGIGISKEHLDHIFDRFKKAGSNEPDSYGIGLAIVKTVADFHKVDLDIESEPGCGTTIKLIFNVSEQV